ncbi:MAG: DoxX family protein [Proteobacteria bacterium]|nr:DoxX family protein [Pseudomonadota bacterium]
MLTMIDRILDRNAGILVLIGRIALSIIFLFDLYGKLTNFSGFAAVRSLSVLPVPILWAIAAVVLLIVGLIGVLLGFKARLGALALSLFCLSTAIIGHPFWIDPAQQGQFLKDLALSGGFLILAVHGPGSYSMDARSL